ncbi:MAG: hypothetical protein LCH63_12890 [Candidatus Melainabacteria bacterium]|nr:hypothetical protein [Candidatus Melainabacteria bacterium]
MSDQASRAVPLVICIAFVLGVYGFSAVSRQADPKFSRELKSSYPTTAYQALFETKSTKGAGTVMLSCDGEGHMRIKELANLVQFSQQVHNTLGQTKVEEVVVNVDRVTILNYLTGKKYIINEQEKTYEEKDLTNLGVGIYDEAMYESSKAKKLPDTTIDGEPVRGWLTTFPLSDADQIEAYFSKRTGCLVKAKGAGVETRLMGYKPVPLPPPAFVPPPSFVKKKSL